MTRKICILKNGPIKAVCVLGTLSYYVTLIRYLTYTGTVCQDYTITQNIEIKHSILEGEDIGPDVFMILCYKNRHIQTIPRKTCWAHARVKLNAAVQNVLFVESVLLEHS